MSKLNCSKFHFEESFLTFDAADRCQTKCKTFKEEEEYREKLMEIKDIIKTKLGKRGHSLKTAINPTDYRLLEETKLPKPCNGIVINYLIKTKLFLCVNIKYKTIIF